MLAFIYFLHRILNPLNQKSNRKNRKERDEGEEKKLDEALLLWSPCFIAGFAYKEGQPQGRPLSKSA